MARTILTVARIEALKPRKTTRDIRDAKLRGFGVRVCRRRAASSFLSSASIAASVSGRSWAMPVP